MHRSYQDLCVAAHGLDLIGERWGLLVVRELILGPKRFTALRAGLPGISPNVLTQRLSELEAKGILRRRKLPPPVSAWIYELTPWGQQLEPVILALGRWAARSPELVRDVPLGNDSIALSMRAMFDAERAGDFAVQLELRFDDDRFVASVAGGGFRIARGEAAQPEVVVRTQPRALAGLLYGGQDLDAFLAAGMVRLEGDRAKFARFLTLFPRPTPATVEPTP